tara:strand:+ start:184 stop:588 length:405 start_codon:yes stop_codon:yes gene_type:complete
VGEYQAAKILVLELKPARTKGFNATDPDGKKYEIKVRCVRQNKSNSQQTSKINIDAEWDYLLLILMNPDFEPLEIHRAKFMDVKRAICEPSSTARNKRQTPLISMVKSIGKRIWKPLSHNELLTKVLKQKRIRN